MDKGVCRLTEITFKHIKKGYQIRIVSIIFTYFYQNLIRTFGIKRPRSLLLRTPHAASCSRWCVSLFRHRTHEAPCSPVKRLKYNLGGVSGSCSFVVGLGAVSQSCQHLLLKLRLAAGAVRSCAGCVPAARIFVFNRIYNRSSPLDPGVGPQMNHV